VLVRNDLAIELGQAQRRARSIAYNLVITGGVDTA